MIDKYFINIKCFLYSFLLHKFTVIIYATLMKKSSLQDINLYIIKGKNAILCFHFAP